MKKIYSDEQIVGFVREADRTEVTIAEFCQQKGFNDPKTTHFSLREAKNC